MTELHISRSPEAGGVTNPSALIAAYEWNGQEGVREMLKVMTYAYPLGPAGNKHATNPQVGKAVIMLLATNSVIDYPRLGLAISTFGSPAELAIASGNYRDGKGAARLAKTIAARYNSSDSRKGMPDLGTTKKLLVVSTHKLNTITHDDALDAEDTRLHPWQRGDGGYKVSIQEMKVGDIELAPSNRDPAKRRKFLENQGTWLEALQQVPDVVKITRRGGKTVFQAVDGGGRLYKKVSIDNDPDYVMNVRVHENVGTTQAVHDLFVALNQSRKAVMPIELFLGALAVKAPDETAISEVLGEFALPENES